MKTKIKIINDLMEIKAITLSLDKPYTWASGLKSPIYCDNRLTISYPKIRENITNEFLTYIKTNFKNVDAIVGTATAGIPQACWISDKLKLPTAYIRSTKKDHGKTNKIEGHLNKVKKVIVIEDLISTGQSSINASQALIENGIEVLAVLSIFDYNLEDSKENFKKANIKYDSLTDFNTLISSLKTTLSKKALAELEMWKKDPTLYTNKFQ